MKKYVFVKGDTNDGDYIAQLTEIKGWKSGEQERTEDDLIDLIKKVAKLVKANKEGYNWAVSEYTDENESPSVLYKGKLTEDEIGEFNENYLPWGNGGIHTIKEIIILEISSESKLL